MQIYKKGLLSYPKRYEIVPEKDTAYFIGTKKPHIMQGFYFGD